MSDYRYSINSTSGNSGQYGVCEVCGKHATEIFRQSEEKSFFNPITNSVSWTQHECKSYFGHRECLEGKRR